MEFTASMSNSRIYYFPFLTNIIIYRFYFLQSCGSGKKGRPLRNFEMKYGHTKICPSNVCISPFFLFGILFAFANASHSTTTTTYITLVLRIFCGDNKCKRNKKLQLLLFSTAAAGISRI